MSVDLLGEPLTGVYPIPDGQARLHERGLTVNGDGGEVDFMEPPNKGGVLAERGGG
jgi:hypothetical protein